MGPGPGIMWFLGTRETLDHSGCSLGLYVPLQRPVLHEAWRKEGRQRRDSTQEGKQVPGPKLVHCHHVPVKPQSTLRSRDCHLHQKLEGTKLREAGPLAREHTARKWPRPDMHQALLSVYTVPPPVQGGIGHGDSNYDPRPLPVLPEFGSLSQTCRHRRADPVDSPRTRISICCNKQTFVCLSRWPMRHFGFSVSTSQTSTSKGRWCLVRGSIAGSGSKGPAWKPFPQAWASCWRWSRGLDAHPQRDPQH